MWPRTRQNHVSYDMQYPSTKKKKDLNHVSLTQEDKNGCGREGRAHFFMKRNILFLKEDEKNQHKRKEPTEKEKNNRKRKI